MKKLFAYGLIFGGCVCLGMGINNLRHKIMNKEDII